jgi:hypothetical protein
MIGYMSKDKDNFIGFKTNKESREKALQFKGPDTSNMIGVKFDNNTMIYFKPGTTKERIEERLKIHKKVRQSWE